MNLLDVYEEMTKQANTTEQAVPEVEVADLEKQAEDAILEKYAEAAVSYLTENEGEGKFDEEDIVKVAVEMINHDNNLIAQAEEAEAQEAMSKVAEAEQIGQIIAASFLKTIESAQ